VRSYIEEIRRLDIDNGGPQERGKIRYPEEIIRRKLDVELIRPGKFDFYRPLLAAWDALTYNSYEGDPYERGLVDWELQEQYEETGDPVVRLTEPEQVQMMDAMAEAAGLENRPGEGKFAIPSHLTEHVDRAHRRMRHLRERGGS
jgi:hypothetical protein